MFAVPWLILLYRWVYRVVVIVRVIRGIILSSAVIGVFAEAGFGAVPMSLLWLCLGRLVLDWLFLVLALFGCIHHVYVI